MISEPSAMSSPQRPQEYQWQELERRWVGLAHRLGLGERTRTFFSDALAVEGPLKRLKEVGGDPDYVLFVLIRYWIPPVLPPPGRERLSKNDPDYWLESEQILKDAVSRLRELKPLIDLLTAPNPFTSASLPAETQPTPVVEVELATMLEGIAEVAGSYGGPDYTSVIKDFDPIPLRQIQPFKHNKKNSSELWVIFLLREHFRALGVGKDRYWPLIAGLIDAAGIYQPNGNPYEPDELKSWWQKNWPRTYTQFDQPHGGTKMSGAAYQSDFDWFHAWLAWQISTSSGSLS